MKRRLIMTALGLLAMPLLAAEPAAEPARSAPPELLAQGLGETAIGLVFVLLLILALAWVFKRFGGRLPMTGRGPVQVVGGVSLGTRERAVLLSVDGRRLLVGVAPGQVRTLYVLEGTEPAGDFAGQLKDVQQERSS
jgi:flagellar protein FliO/FliZ